MHQLRWHRSMSILLHISSKELEGCPKMPIQLIYKNDSNEVIISFFLQGVTVLLSVRALFRK